MGVPMTEFCIETVLRDGLGDLRTNPDKLDDIFSRFKEAQFINQYGQTQIDRLKTFLQRNQIKIVHAWSMVPTSLPCFSIQMMRSNEEEDLQQFGNEYEEIDENIEPHEYVASLTPGTYNAVSGKLTVTGIVDLSAIRPGLIFVDAADVEFEILKGISNLSGNKYINIGSGKEPDLSGPGRIISSVDRKQIQRRMIRLRESINIGCHSNDDVHITKYLYYLLMYILKSRQESLINRGIHLDKGSGGVFDRADEYKGENVFSRFMDVGCITEFDWNQSEVNYFDSFDINIKVPTPNPDSPTAAPINSDED